MNSVHRVGVAVATVAAAITVSGAVIVRGVMPGTPAQYAVYPAAFSAPKIVYISAAKPTPVTTPAPPAPPDTPQIIYQVVAGYGDDDGGGSGD